MIMTTTKESKRKDFCYAIGEAMYQWKMVEWAMFQLFSLATKWPNRELASAVFYSSDYFSDHVALFDRVLYSQAYQTKGLRIDEWETLKSRCISANTKRNEIAHWPLVGSDRDLICLQKDFHDIGLEIFKGRLKPVPQASDTRTIAKRLAELKREETARDQRLLALKKRRLSTPEIRAYAEEFLLLSRDMLSLAVNARERMRLSNSSKSKGPGPRPDLE